jgi:hypothetical protein
MVTLTSCEYVDNSLKVKNTKPYRITVRAFDKGRPSFNGPYYYIRNDNVIGPQNVGHLGLFTQHWRDVVNKLPGKRLQFIVFKVDTIEKYKDSLTMYQLFDQKKYDGLMSYSLDNLEEQNWLVTY